MAVTTISSKANPFVKKLRLAASQSRRAPAETVLAEGTRVLGEALAAGHKIEGVLISESFGNSRREKALVSLLRSRGVQLYLAADALVKSLSNVVTPQGVLGLVRVPARSLGTIELSSNPLILCAVGIQDPGNLGTLIRSAAAAGVCVVCTTLGTVSAKNSKCVRSSAGIFFSIPVVEDLSPGDFLEFCEDHAVCALRADVHAGKAYCDVDLTKPTAILLGGESQGLAASEWSTIPAIRIPMSPGVESLNVAAAGSVLLFEACRQRRASRMIQ